MIQFYSKYESFEDVLRTQNCFTDQTADIFANVEDFDNTSYAAGAVAIIFFYLLIDPNYLGNLWRWLFRRREAAAANENSLSEAIVTILELPRRIAP